MGQAGTTEIHSRPDAPLHNDGGATFIELLISIVLIGITGVAVLTALSVSMAGSDQHRSKVNAVSELEGAGAFLARTAFGADCGTSAGDLNTLLGSRPGTISNGITIGVDTVTCTADGLRRASLLATSDKGHAIERLDVTLGGISVLQPEGSVPSSPVCVWGSLTASPPSGVTAHTSGANDGKLKSGATIQLRLTFNGPCVASVPAMITSSSPLPGSFTRNLVQDPLDPLVLNYTLTSNEVHWEPATYTVSVGMGVANATFVIG